MEWCLQEAGGRVSVELASPSGGRRAKSGWQASNAGALCCRDEVPWCVAMHMPHPYTEW